MATMGITPGLITGLFTMYSSVFNEAYTSVAPWWRKLATEVPSNTAQNTYPFIAKIPRVRQWIGERVLQNLATYNYTLANQDYELTLEVERNVIADGGMAAAAIYNTQFAQMGSQAAKWPDDLITSLLRNGQSLKCYDGANFFDTSHPISSAYGIPGAQQNYWSTGKALTAANYDFARSTFLSQLGEDQRPFGLVPDTIIVPPQLEYTAHAIVDAPINASGATNVYTGSAKVLMIPELVVDPTTWYLVATNGPVKPFIFQIRQEPNLVPRMSPTDDNVFWHRKLVAGIDMRGNAGFGLWFMAAKFVA